MKKCPFCAEEIQDAAVVCKHCGRDLAPDATVAETSVPPAKHKSFRLTPSGGGSSKESQGQRAGLGCLIVFVALFGSCWYILTPDDSPEAQAERALSTARVMTATICQLQMEARLTSPATADFPFALAANVQALTNENTYRLRSYVDSQNAFGATVRTDFECVVTGSGDELSGYSLVSLDAE